MDWLSWLEKKQGGTGGTRKYWLYADGKTSKEAGWHNQIHDNDDDEMNKGSVKITHDHDGNEGYFGVTLRNHLSDSQRSHINQQIKENRYHQFPKNISFDHGHNNNDTVNSSKKYYPKNQHTAENFHPKTASWESWLEKTEPTGLTARQKKLAKEIADGDKDDHTQYYTKASWETWLEKEEKPKERDYLAEMQTLGEQNMYQNSSKKKKFIKEAKGAGKKIKQQMGENDLPLNYSKRLRTNIKRPAERVTDNDLSDLDGWVEETKSWETWLEKGRWDNPKHDTNTQKEYEAFEKLSKLPKNEVTELGDSIDEAIEGVKSGKLKKSWESWLEKNDPCWEGYEQYGMKDKDGKKVPNCIKKNNAIETSHKEDEKKHEWDGKFSSSTIRDDVKDDDDKAVSEEESLEELTDGKLEEVEKLKSWELWLEKDALDGKGGNEAKDDLMMPSLMGMYKKPTKQTKEGQARDYIRDDHNVDSYHMRRLGHGKKYESGRRPLEKKPQSGGFVDGSRKEEWDITADQDASKRGSGTNTFDDKDDVEPSGGFIQGQGRTVPKTGIAPNIKPQGKGVKHKGRPRGSKNKAWEDWLEKDALNPDSKDKPSLMNTQRFARISTEVRGGNAQGGKLGDASLRGMRAEEKKRGKKYKWKNPDRKGRGGEKKELYHGTERQAGNYPALGTDSGKESGEKFAKLFQEEKKSWELWLTKYEETPEDKKLALQLDEARAITGKKVATQKVKPETGEDAKMGEYSKITAEKFKSWTTWLEKMQGAGDARFGNQHLTGLDQKPVDNEEDEANILPEKEQKTDNKEEKQEKTEDKEDKDNKPYKALSQE